MHCDRRFHPDCLPLCTHGWYFSYFSSSPLAVFVNATYLNHWSIKWLLISTRVSKSLFLWGRCMLYFMLSLLSLWGTVDLLFCLQSRNFFQSKSNGPEKMKISSCLWYQRSPSLCNSGSGPWTPTTHPPPPHPPAPAKLPYITGF